MSSTRADTAGTAADRGGARTRRLILDAAWELIRSEGLDVPMKKIAARVGISRQALYLHFPSRAGLLRAMTIHHDMKSRIGERCVLALEGAGSAVEALEAVLRVWFDYVPDILPVARALEAAAATDPEAAAAWWEAMDRALGFTRRIVQCLAAEGLLDSTSSIEEAAQQLWELTHVRTWDDLVVHHGWDPDRFVDRQIEVARRTLLGD